MLLAAKLLMIVSVICEGSQSIKGMQAPSIILHLDDTKMGLFLARGPTVKSGVLPRTIKEEIFYSVLADSDTPAGCLFESE